MVASEFGGRRPARAAGITPEKVLEATFIKTGQIYSLGGFTNGAPPPGKRHFSLTIPGSPTQGPTGKNMESRTTKCSRAKSDKSAQFDGLGRRLPRRQRRHFLQRP
jgi:hypothetical protein